LFYAVILSAAKNPRISPLPLLVLAFATTLASGPPRKIQQKLLSSP